MYKCPQCNVTFEQMGECQTCKVPMVNVDAQPDQEQNAQNQDQPVAEN